LKEGAIAPELLPSAARALGMDRVAITDRDSLAGAVRFTKACRDTGVAPVYGVRLTLARDEVTAAAGERFMLTLLAQSNAGYGNLCRLLSAAHARGERGDPCATLPELAAHAEGIVAVAGRGSEVVALVTQRREEDARATLRELLEIFGHRRLRLAVTHLAEREDDARTRHLLAFAESCEVGCVATNEVRMLQRADAFVCDTLDAMRALVPLARHHRSSRTSEAWLKPGELMARIFEERPELLTNAYELAASCEVSIALGTVRVPPYPITGRPLTRNEANSLLARRCHEGLARRGMPVTSSVRRRLDVELAMCARLGFAAYFLVVADLVAMVRAMGIRCACRGSAAGSLLCYALSISDVDPIEHDLVFERFMNLHRAHELPDIDLDVESARREDVYRAIIDRVPPGRGGCLTMIDIYQARGAIREVGKALGLPDGELGIIAKSFPHVRAAGITKALERLPELRGVEHDRLAMLFDVCERLDGFPRHLALHPSGVLISPSNLTEIAPLERSAHGFPMAQLDKHDVEDLGLLKLDVLGVRMLSAMTHATAEVRRLTGEIVDIDTIDREDPATFELIRASRTLGCFQIESPGQRELIQKLVPERWKDLIVEISLFRPGPVRSDMVNPYLMRRAGFTRPFYAHPALRDSLRESHGVVVYHEQVMRCIAAVTGVDLGVADLIRRRLGDDGQLPELRAWFFKEGRANGWRDGEIEPIWHEVASFAAFGFCKAHAAAFAVPTYQSAWLKTHHPAAFFAGVLTHDPGMYPRRALLDDARQEGVPILPLEVNRSQRHYTAERIPTSGPLIAQPVDALAHRVEPAVHLERQRVEPHVHRIEPCVDLVEPRVDPLEPCVDPREPLIDLVEPCIDPAFEADEHERHHGERERREHAERSPDLHHASMVRDEAAPRYPSRPVPPVPLAHAFGVRIGLMNVEGITDDEIASILDARTDHPFDGLVDLARRARLKRPVIEALIHAGACDAFGNRRDLLLGVGELWERGVAKPERAQRELTPHEPVISWGLREYTAAEKVRAELEVLGLDVSRHLISFYEPVLQRVGATHAKDLRRTTRRNDRVLVAGVKVASQTPQIRGGQRIIFLTLDDGHGLVDVTVFEAVQDRCAEPAFHCWLQLVRGTVHRTGRAGLSINAERIWDLGDVARAMAAGTLDIDELWTEGVAEIEAAERTRLAARRGQRDDTRDELAERGDPIPKPPIRLPRNGPAGAPSASPPRRLWHHSAGSAG
jgi:error-prone DNA polymerase